MHPTSNKNTQTCVVSKYYNNHPQKQQTYFEPAFADVVIPPSPLAIPDISEMKKKRKTATVMMGVTTGLAGLVLLGPIGGVAAGVVGAYAIKGYGKRKERRKMKKYGKKIAEDLYAAERKAFQPLFVQHTTRRQ